MRQKLYKTLFFTITLVYVFAITGVCVVSHYCGGELMEVSVFNEPENCCGDEEEENDCCKNESVHVSFQNDFTFSAFIKGIKQPLDFINTNGFNQLSYLNFDYVNPVKLNSQIEYPPPDLVQKEMIAVSNIRI